MKVFVSYSWDDEKHKSWVMNLADKLRSDGIDAVLDRYYLNVGKNISTFVEDNLQECDRILVILTPNYKLKADNRKGGVGHEYSIINQNLIKDIKNNERVIPILRSGSVENSIPIFLQSFLYSNFINDSDFENEYENLIREIYKEPKIKIPVLGEKPNFEGEKKKI